MCVARAAVAVSFVLAALFYLLGAVEYFGGARQIGSNLMIAGSVALLTATIGSRK